MTNLKVDNLDAKNLKLNGTSISALVSEAEIDEKDAVVLQEAKDYTDEHASGGGFSVYVQGEYTQATLTATTVDIVTKNDLKSAFNIGWTDESLIHSVKMDQYAPVFWFYNTRPDRAITLGYYSLISDGSVTSDGYHTVQIAADSGVGYSGDIWYDSKNDKLWFANLIGA